MGTSSSSSQRSKQSTGVSPLPRFGLSCRSSLHNAIRGIAHSSSRRSLHLIWLKNVEDLIFPSSTPPATFTFRRTHLWPIYGAKHALLDPSRINIAPTIPRGSRSSSPSCADRHYPVPHTGKLPNLRRSPLEPSAQFSTTSPNSGTFQRPKRRMEPFSEKKNCSTNGSPTILQTCVPRLDPDDIRLIESR